MIGEPAKTEQESPGFTNELQFVFAEPLPNPDIVYWIVTCAVPFPANVMNGLFGPNPELALIVAPFASKTASDGVKAPESRHPTAPSVPLQPWNINDVVFDTSAFHGGPAGFPAVLVLNVILVSVTAVVPLPDDVFKSPTTVADAIVTKHSKISVARGAGPLKALIRVFPPPNPCASVGVPRDAQVYFR